MVAKISFAPKPFSHMRNRHRFFPKPPLPRAGAVLIPVAALFSLTTGCAVFPRHFQKVDEDVKWLSYVSPAGVEIRPGGFERGSRHGADAYFFRMMVLHRKTLLGGGLEAGQVMYFKESPIYLTLLSPYVYYSPLGLLQTEYAALGGEIGRRIRTLPYLYAGWGFLSVPLKESEKGLPQSHFDAGIGLTYRRIDLRLGSVYKYRRSEKGKDLFPYVGLSFQGFGLRSRQFHKLGEEIKWLSYVSPAGVEIRPPYGANMYLFRMMLLHGKYLIGGGVEAGQIMFFDDSPTYLTLLSPYVYYSPFGVVEREYVLPSGEIGRKIRTFSYLYAGGGFLSLPREEGEGKPPKSHFDAGIGLTFKRIDLRIGAVYKYRNSDDDRDFFPYVGLHYQVFGSPWQLGW